MLIERQPPMEEKKATPDCKVGINAFQRYDLAFFDGDPYAERTKANRNVENVPHEVFNF